MFGVTVGCAPCEDGHVPSMPDCDCTAPLPECCGATGFGALSCCTDQCTAHGGALVPCIISCGQNLPVYPPCPQAVKSAVTVSTVEVSPGPNQPTSPTGCGPGEHPAPCAIGDVIDVVTGCCAPSNVLEIPIALSRPVGPAMLDVPLLSGSDFLASAAQFNFAP